jgi:hypothetical protein
MRAVRVLSIAALVLCSWVVPAFAHHAPGPCDFHRIDGETVQHFSARQIRCAVDTFGPVPGGSARAVCIADRESGLLPDAESLTGMYLGLYQHSAADWDRRYDTYTKPAWELPTSALKGRTNAIVAIRMVVAAGTWRAAGWPPGDC